MTIQLPPEPTQQGAFFDYIRKMHRVVQQLVPLNSYGVRHKITPRGTFTEAQPKRGASAPQQDPGDARYS